MSRTPRKKIFEHRKHYHIDRRRGKTPPPLPSSTTTTGTKTNTSSAVRSIASSKDLPLLGLQRIDKRLPSPISIKAEQFLGRTPTELILKYRHDSSASINNGNDDTATLAASAAVTEIPNTNSEETQLYKQRQVLQRLHPDLGIDNLEDGVISRKCLQVVAVTTEDIVLHRLQEDPRMKVRVLQKWTGSRRARSSTNLVDVSPDQIFILQEGDTIMIHSERHSFRVVTLLLQEDQHCLLASHDDAIGPSSNGNVDPGVEMAFKGNSNVDLDDKDCIGAPCPSRNTGHQKHFQEEKQSEKEKNYGDDTLPSMPRKKRSYSQVDSRETFRPRRQDQNKLTDTRIIKDDGNSRTIEDASIKRRKVADIQGEMKRETKRFYTKIDKNSWWTCVRQSIVARVDSNSVNPAEVELYDRTILSFVKKNCGKTQAFAHLSTGIPRRYVGSFESSENALIALPLIEKYKEGDLTFIEDLTGAKKVRIVCDQEALATVPFRDTDDAGVESNDDLYSLSGPARKNPYEKKQRSKKPFSVSDVPLSNETDVGEQRTGGKSSHEDLNCIPIPIRTSQVRGDSGTDTTTGLNEKLKALLSSKKTKLSPKEATKLFESVRDAVRSTIQADTEVDLLEIGEGDLKGLTPRSSGNFQAQIFFEGKSRYIGVFNTEAHAAFAYQGVRRQLRLFEKSKNVPSVRRQPASRTKNPIPSSKKKRRTVTPTPPTDQNRNPKARRTLFGKADEKIEERIDEDDMTKTLLNASLCRFYSSLPLDRL
jgi:hypothetical protein